MVKNGNGKALMTISLQRDSVGVAQRAMTLRARFESWSAIFILVNVSLCKVKACSSKSGAMAFNRQGASASLVSAIGMLIIIGT